MKTSFFKLRILTEPNDIVKVRSERPPLPYLRYREPNKFPANPN